MSAHADIDIKIGGTAVADLGIKLGTLTLVEAMGDHGTFRLECLALDEGTAAAVSGSQAKLDALFQKLGQELQISLRSPDRNTSRHSLDWIGLVTDVHSERARGGGYTVFLEGKSHTVLMDLESHFRYGPHDDSARHLRKFLDAVTEEYGALCSVAVSANPLTDYGMQYSETDFNFLNRLAQREKLWCFYDGVKFHITETLPTEEIELTMGPNQQENALDRFKIRTGVQSGSFGIATEDWKTGTALQSVTDSISLPGSLHPWAQKAKSVYEEKKVHVGAAFAERHMASQSELESYQTARKASWAGNLVHVEGGSSNADVRLGRKVNLTALGDGQAAKYIVTRVSHTMDVFRGTYENDFTAVPEQGAAPAWDNRRPQALEVYDGVVVDEGDDDHKGLVKVRVYGAGPTGDLWARVVQPFAGESGGMYMLPEIGDEVVLAFSDGDPSRPVVLGSVYRGTGGRASAVFDDVTNNQKNTRHMIRTRSGHKLVFEDAESGSEGVIFVLTGDGKNEIKLTGKSGEDKIEIKTHGSVVVSADGDITMSAGGKIHLEAGGDIETKSKGVTRMKSEQDITLDADGDIKETAKGEADVSGNGGVNVDSKGDISISAKGSVDISGNLNANLAGTVGSKIQGGTGTVECGASGVTATGPMIKLN